MHYPALHPLVETPQRSAFFFAGSFAEGRGEGVSGAVILRSGCAACLGAGEETVGAPVHCHISFIYDPETIIIHQGKICALGNNDSEAILRPPESKFDASIKLRPPN